MNYIKRTLTVLLLTGLATCQIQSFNISDDTRNTLFFKAIITTLMVSGHVFYTNFYDHDSEDGAGQLYFFGMIFGASLLTADLTPVKPIIKP